MSDEKFYRMRRLPPYVIAEVNACMPRVHGGAWVHVSELDAIVEHDEPITELPIPSEREEDRAMGEIIFIYWADDK